MLRNALRRLSDVLFNIAVNAFRHMMIGLPFRSSSLDTKAERDSELYGLLLNYPLVTSTEKTHHPSIGMHQIRNNALSCRQELTLRV